MPPSGAVESSEAPLCSAGSQGTSRHSRLCPLTTVGSSDLGAHLEVLLHSLLHLLLHLLKDCHVGASQRRVWESGARTSTIHRDISLYSLAVVFTITFIPQDFFFQVDYSLPYTWEYSVKAVYSEFYYKIRCAFGTLLCPSGTDGAKDTASTQQVLGRSFVMST